MHKISRSNPVPLAAQAPQAHPRQPSPRNVEIFCRVRQQGERQEDVAREFGLTQARVSQICTQVQAWREWADERRSGEESRAALRRLARDLARQRNEQIYILVAQGLAKKPLDRQWLKLAIKVSDKMQDLEEDLPPEKRFTASAAGQKLAAVLREAAAQQQLHGHGCEALRPADGGADSVKIRSGEIPNIGYLINGRKSPINRVMPGRLPGARRGAAAACGESGQTNAAEVEAVKEEENFSSH
jgi:hypothetical protein